MNKQTYNQPNSTIIKCQYSSSLMEDWISIKSGTTGTGSIIINAKRFNFDNGAERQVGDSIGEKDNIWENS